MMNIEKTIIEIGLEKPLKVLHITDSHLPLCDERDDAYLQGLAAQRRSEYEDFLAPLEEQIMYAMEHCDLLVHTGDLIDFLSKANLEFARKWLKNDKGCPCRTCPFQF